MLPPIPEIPQCPDRLSLAGCAPAEPASVSPARMIVPSGKGDVKGKRDIRSMAELLPAGPRRFGDCVRAPAKAAVPDTTVRLFRGRQVDPNSLFCEGGSSARCRK